MKILVTGGAGFIGSNLIRYLLDETDVEIFNVDKLTFPGSLLTIQDFEDSTRYSFAQVDICDASAMRNIVMDFAPDAIVHLAAESHVDRSIDSPSAFIHSNIVGTYTLLEAARDYWRGLLPEQQRNFRFHHTSTDEVFGSLSPSDPAFTEKTPYAPNSPYSASKAAADHLVRSWYHTFGLPVTISNCSNNYGPYQFPEKLIPLIILAALKGEPLPVYGTGKNVRDWLYVEDHVRALYQILLRGKVGASYNIGGHCEMANIEVVHTLCGLLDELSPNKGNNPHSNLIEFVTDRPGHDLRYAMSTEKLQTELDWQPQESFASGLRKTVHWYMKNLDWCERVISGSYQGERLGLG